MPKEIDPSRVDVRRFAEEAGRAEATLPLARWARLLAETEGGQGEGAVHWVASGELRNARHHQPDVWLHLQATTTLPLVCQRCLLPVETQVSVDRSFRFVADEALAAAEDDASEEDVLALSRQFDLLGLIEDELLMEMPPAPRHEVCPVPVKMSAADPAFELAAAPREHPFAVLGTLKPPRRQG